MFFRERTINGRRYLYAERRWRENGKVMSWSRVVGRVDAFGAPDLSGITGSPLWTGLALPFMIAGDLASGSRVKALIEARQRAMSEQARAPTAWQLMKGTASPASKAAMYREYAKEYEKNQRAKDSEALRNVDWTGAPVANQQHTVDKGYAPKGSPTGEEEATHAQWSDNQRAERDEMYDEYVDEGAPAVDAAPAEGQSDGEDGDSGSS